MAFMPTRYLRTERDDVQQFFIDLDAKPAHGGEWRKVGQWNKDGSLSLAAQTQKHPTQHTDAEHAAWLADKICNGGDYAKEAASMLYRWPEQTQQGEAAHPVGGELTYEQILSCLDGRQPVRAHNGAGVFEYRLFALVEFARRVLALAATPKAAPAAVSEPTEAMFAAVNAVYNLLDRSDVEAIIRAVLALAAQPAVATSDSAKPAGEPMFWVRLCGDGLYEGPVHHKSAEGKMLREEKPSEWHPLYLAAAPMPDSKGAAVPVAEVASVSTSYPFEVAVDWLVEMNHDFESLQKLGVVKGTKLYLHPSDGAQAAGQEDARDALAELIRLQDAGFIRPTYRGEVGKAWLAARAAIAPQSPASGGTKG